MLAVREVVLRVGEAHRVVLEGYGSAGFQWTHEVGGTPGTLEIKVTSVALPPDEPMTSNAVQECTITALEPGSASIRFELRRPWEDKAKQPLRAKLINITVTE